MTDLTRRRFLQTAGALGLASAIAACDTSPSGDGNSGGEGGGPITWWGFAEGLEDANDNMFKQFEQETGIPVEYTFHQVDDIGETLTLAKQSGDLPDVFMPALELPTAALIDEDWFQPLQVADEALDRLPEGSLIDGIHVFDGDIYAIPIFTHKQYWTANWFNKEMLAAAEVETPTTYDDFRAAARAVQDSAGDDTYGWVFNLGMPDRVGLQVDDLAQGAGFEGGAQGTLYKTGEVMYEHDTYLNVIEFLVSMQKDKLIFPASGSLIDKDARLRWAAGGAGFFFDGPWCNGVVRTDIPDFLDKLDVGPMLVPEAGQIPITYRGPELGQFYLSGTSKKAKEVSQLLGHLTTPEYAKDIAAGMDKMPLDLDAVADSDAHPAYKKLAEFFAEQAFLGPVPVVKNLDVDEVNIEARPITPTLGDIVTGVFTGDVTDVKKELKSLSDKTMKMREENVAKAEQNGAKVELDDWAFPNWKPGQDYTPEMYG